MKHHQLILLLLGILLLGCDSLRPDDSTTETLPHSPVPASGSFNLDTVVTFSWEPGLLSGTGVRYGLFLGSPTPDNQLIDDLESPTVRVTSLSRNRTYAWRVFAHDGVGNADTSETWYFTTGSRENLAPYIPSSPVPSVDATDVVLSPTLNWIGGDPDGGDVSYDVYFGKRGELLTKVRNGGSALFFEPASLEPLTVYLWRIDATDSEGVTSQSPVWSFITGPRPQQQLVVTLRNDGLIGDPSGDRPGIVYPLGSDREMLAIGGFWVGAAGPGQLPLSIVDLAGQSEFTPSAGEGRERPPLGFVTLGDGRYVTSFAFDDITREEENVGVYVEVDATLEREGEGPSGGILLRYRVTNYGELMREGVVASWFLDLDISTATPQDDHLGYDPLRHLAYAYDESSEPFYAGIGLISDTPPVLASQWWRFGEDPVNREEYWQWMNGIHPDAEGLRIRPAPEEAGDYRLLLSAGPLDMQPWQVAEYVVAIVVGSDQRDMNSVFDMLRENSETQTGD